MRQVRFTESHGLAYGMDHLCGLFIQVWKLDPKYPPKSIQNYPDPENIVLSKDALFHKLTIEEVVNIGDQYGFNLYEELEPTAESYEIPF